MECIWADENKEEIVAKCANPHDLHPFMYVTRFGPQFYPFVHAAFGGMAGANSIMFAKAVLIFGKNMITGPDRGLSAAYLAAFLVPCGLCLFLQIKYLNVALQIYRDSLFVLPCYQSFWIVFGIAAGLIFYQEYKQLDSWHVLLFTLGVAISLGGVVVLSLRSAASKDGKTREMPAPEFIPHRDLTCTNMGPALNKINADMYIAMDDDEEGAMYVPYATQNPVSADGAAAVGIRKSGLNSSFNEGSENNTKGDKSALWAGRSAPM